MRESPYSCQFAGYVGDESFYEKRRKNNGQKNIRAEKDTFLKHTPCERKMVQVSCQQMDGSHAHGLVVNEL